MIDDGKKNDALAFRTDSYVQKYKLCGDQKQVIILHRFVKKTAE